MFGLLILASAIGLASSIVCPKDYCKNVKQPVLNCKGGTIKHAGFCGCIDICAKVEGESCRTWHFRGVPNTEICDEGLVCQTDTEGIGAFGGKCVRKGKKPESTKARRQSHCQTLCQRKSLMCTISMIVYQGQWFAKCDQNGDFLPEQCDNTNHCFCVDTTSGAIIDGTKVLGSANC
ncbi:hypothetical protein Btru_020618 [Bulinus truncatus]|nr:hypothetical protein Btru_020618 [Bulinus truncatus]